MRTVFVDPLIDGRQGLPQSRDSIVGQAPRLGKTGRLPIFRCAGVEVPVTANRPRRAHYQTNDPQTTLRLVELA